jgi:hypothetical protein
MFMREPDLLDALLREEWKSPEPAAALDHRVTAAWRSAVRPSAWRRFWSLRVSVPVPALGAAMLTIFALYFWLRPAAAPPMPAETPGVVTRLNTSGFQPLPNGEARVIPAVEIRK